MPEVFSLAVASTPGGTSSGPETEIDPALEPERLWLVAPRSAGIQGEYSKQRGRDKHGQAIWRQASGAGWLFSSGLDGFWCFAKKESDIGNKMGQVQSAIPHGGCGPHEIQEWQYHDWSTWRVDISIFVTACRETYDRALDEQEAEGEATAVGDRLWIVVSAYAGLQGEYTKCPDRIERGQCVWQQVGGNGWLFGTAKGRWFVTDGEAGIEKNGGVLASTHPHTGKPPEEMTQWQYFCDGKWHVDATILVTTSREKGEQRLAEQEAEALLRADAAPEKLWLVSSAKPGLQGEYSRQTGRLERGQAVWKQVIGTGVLYSNGLGGFWCFANKEADIMKNLGILQSSAAHEGKAPHEISSWQFADGCVWKNDSSICVTASAEQGKRVLADQEAEAVRRVDAAPVSLWLTCCPSQLPLQGEYAKQVGRIERGQAVWRQIDGDGWLYSTAGGRWFIANREDAIGLCGGVLASATPHQGLSPHTMAHWQVYVDGMWQAEASVRVTLEREDPVVIAPQLEVSDTQCTADAPEILWLQAPPMPLLEGEFKKHANRMEHGMAVWRQTSGSGWLYLHDQGDTWCFTLREADIAGSFGVIRCPQPHKDSFPHECGEWQYLEEGEWRSDASISVRQMISRMKSVDEPKHVHAQGHVPAPTGSEGQTRALGQVPTPRTAPVVSSFDARARPPPVVQDQDHHAPTDAPTDPRAVADRVRAEITKLLERAGLPECEFERNVDIDRMVSECIQVVNQEGRSVHDADVVSRVVLRVALMQRHSTQVHEEEIKPQLICACPASSHLPMFNNMSNASEHQGSKSIGCAEPCVVS